jgi:hypothetical protein
LDLSPIFVSGLTAKLTYYNIVIKDKIANAGGSISNYLNLSNESIGGPEVYQTNPSSAAIQQWITEPTFYNGTGAPLDANTIGVIIDSRDLNLSTYKTQGLDFGFNCTKILAGRQFQAGVDGTYIFDFYNQFSSTAPTVSILNTAYNPVDLRLRAKVIVTQNQLSGGLYGNFTNSYSSGIVPPIARVASWTTADAVVAYAVRSSDSYFDGLSISLSVVNLTGRDPPFVRNSTYGINYDGANANPLGRFLSIRIGKRW